MAENGAFSLSLERVEGLQFRVRYDWESIPPMVLDEPEPMGQRKGPNASRLLAAAVGNCLTASLLFCLEKSKVEVRAATTSVTGSLKRNERGRLRVGKIDVRITVDVPDGQSQRLSRCLELFEDYCVVTASVRQGIEVTVGVSDIAGNVLLAPGS